MSAFERTLNKTAYRIVSYVGPSLRPITISALAVLGFFLEGNDFGNPRERSERALRDLARGGVTLVTPPALDPPLTALPAPVTRIVTCRDTDDRASDAGWADSVRRTCVVRQKTYTPTRAARRACARNDVNSRELLTARPPPHCSQTDTAHADAS